MSGPLEWLQHRNEREKARREGVIEGLERAEKIAARLAEEMDGKYASGSIQVSFSIRAEIERVRNDAGK